VIVPRSYALLGPAYLAALLAVDTQVGARGQVWLGLATCIVLVAALVPLTPLARAQALGVVTGAVLVAALVPLTPLARAQALGVVAVATVGEVTGSLVWGVYRYRLHNLPLFIPPAHGIVYLSGVALVGVVRPRLLVGVAAAGAAAWGLAGVTVLPRLDVAGAFGVPLLLVFLWRSRFRAAYAGVFLVVAALELYGTSIWTWRWAATLPGLGIADGNPPSGVASGYVWFDVMALLVAPWLLYAAGGAVKPNVSLLSGADRSSKRRIEPSGTMSASGASSRRSAT
jgi:hypothetical protein